MLCVALNDGSDLRRLGGFDALPAASLTGDDLRRVLDDDAALALATRARRRAAFAAFVAWCRRQQLIDHDPMLSLESIRLNAGVSLAIIRKRLGHARIDTTLIYAEIADATSDAAIRQWRGARG